MNASSIGLVAAALAALVPIDSSIAAAVMARQPRLERHAREFRSPLRDERALHDERGRFERGRRRFPGDWLAGDTGLPDPADLGAEAPATAFFEGPSTNITITMAPPIDARAAMPAYAPAGGPKIMTIGARPRSARFATTPIVVYGRAPAGQVY